MKLDEFSKLRLEPLDRLASYAILVALCIGEDDSLLDIDPDTVVRGILIGVELLPIRTAALTEVVVVSIPLKEEAADDFVAVLVCVFAFFHITSCI